MVSEPEQSHNKKLLAEMHWWSGRERGKQGCREGNTQLLCNFFFTFEDHHNAKLHFRLRNGWGGGRRRFQDKMCLYVL